jgi:hypothetical protein
MEPFTTCDATLPAAGHSIVDLNAYERIVGCASFWLVEACVV